MRRYDITPDYAGPGGGGGPEDEPGSTRYVIRTQGLMPLAFGVALGLVFIVFFLLQGIISVPAILLSGIDSLWESFLVGFVPGIIIAAIYNMLVVRRLNLFGLESNAD